MDHTLGSAGNVYGQGSKTADSILFNDVHFHLTNYIQKGVPIKDFLQVMGNKVGRVALFGIPLQQQWAYNVTGDLHRGIIWILMHRFIIIRLQTR